VPLFKVLLGAIIAGLVVGLAAAMWFALSSPGSKSIAIATATLFGACAPQKHYSYLRPPSCGPAFDRQAGDLTKVCEIAREKGRVTGHDNRRNFQVHCSDP
jgi:hypothetical protein